MARKVLIAGAGASGLMAAAAAAEAGAEVTVLETMERPGRKLLLTGNGRCNLTNMDPELPSRYYGSGRELAQTVTRKFGAVQTRRFFEELGLLTMEKNGYVYPYSMQSSAVLDVLLAELRGRRVRLKLNEKIEKIERTERFLPETGKQSSGSDKDSGGWTVRTSSWSYRADAIVLACGSRCLPKTGSDGSGYHLASQLGHTIVTPRPALAALNCSGDFFAALAGVRCHANVTLLENGKPVKSETGELQWTKYGVSGIVVFQLSRFVRGRDVQRDLLRTESVPANQVRRSGSAAGRRRAGHFETEYTLSVDLLPEFDEAYLAGLLSARAEKLSKETAAVLLKGILHDRLIPPVLARADIPKSQPCAGLDDPAVNALIRQMKSFTLSVSGVRSFDECQVCSGGVDCREIDADTLESKLHRNLYFAGELLDVDGPCGGYNLQWAWASGYLAGRAAASGADGNEMQS